MDKLIYSLISVALSILVVSCGGGGSSSSTSSSSSSTISGVAASGAPLDNADIQITCADGSVKTSTTNSSGQFNIDVGSGCPAPYVLKASKDLADRKEELVSVHPETVSGSQIVNITTLTNAIAATLATDGNPLSLASNIESEKTNITSTAVDQRNQALVNSLSSMISAAGVTGTPNLLRSSFSADRTGLDKVLDNLKIVVTPAGVNITNPAGVRVDDMGHVGSSTVASNLSSGTISFSRNTNFNSSLGSVPAAVDDGGAIDEVQTALNACFALLASSRISSSGSFQGACASLSSRYIAEDYRHDGKNLAQEWNGMMTSANYTGAIFSKPDIIRYFSSSAADSRALVRFGLMRADGIGEWFTSVAEKSTNTGGTWKLRGNQRLYAVSVNAYVTREEQLLGRGSGTASERPQGVIFHSGLNLYFRGDSNIKYALVKGPGLPAAGVYLRLKDGCSYFAIASNATSTPPSCTSLYRMQYRKATSSDPESNYYVNGFGRDPFFAPSAVSDGDLELIQPFSAYRFEIFRTTNNTSTPDYVYVERLRGRPLKLGTNATIGKAEVDGLIFNTGLSDSVKSMINPDSSSPFNGGTNFTLTWSNSENAPPVNSVQIQSTPTGGLSGTLYQDEVNVRLNANTVTLNNSGVGWGGTVLNKSAGNFILVQLRGRDKNDLRYFQNWRY